MASTAIISEIISKNFSLQSSLILTFEVEYEDDDMVSSNNNAWYLYKI